MADLSNEELVDAIARIEAMEGIDADVREALLKSARDLHAAREAQALRKPRAPKGPMTVAQKIARSRTRAKPPVGRNKAVPEFINKNDDVRVEMAHVLADCEGVTVDVAKFKISDQLMQAMLLVYGLREVGIMAGTISAPTPPEGE